jgi:hypothetical protein
MESGWKALFRFSGDIFPSKKEGGCEEKRKFRVFSEYGMFVFVMVVV